MTRVSADASALRVSAARQHCATYTACIAWVLFVMRVVLCAAVRYQRPWLSQAFGGREGSCTLLVFSWVIFVRLPIAFQNKASAGTRAGRCGAACTMYG